MWQHFRSRRLFVEVLVLVICCWAAPAFAQDGTPTEENRTAEYSVRIYEIKHNRVSSVMNTIMEIAGDPRLSTTNLPPRFAQDAGTNSLIVSANERTHQMVETLLKSLDVEKVNADIGVLDTRDVMIRVVWLVDERLIDGDQIPVPPDLLPTVEKLRARFGLETLVTAGQIVINQQIGSDPHKQNHFDGSGTATVQGTSEFQVDGIIEMTASNTAELEVHLHSGPVRIIEVGGSRQKTEGSELTRKVKKPMCEITSRISATVGKPVFFGMASLESKPSLFVVQVLDASEVTTETADKAK